MSQFSVSSQRVDVFVLMEVCMQLTDKIYRTVLSAGATNSHSNVVAIVFYKVREPMLDKTLDVRKHLLG